MSTFTINLPIQIRPKEYNNTYSYDQDINVAQALEKMFERTSSLRHKIFPDGKLNKFINIYVNDEDIRFLEDLDTIVNGNDVIDIVTAIAGG